MNRTPMKRRPPRPGPRKRLRDAQIRAYPYCEARSAGAPPVSSQSECYGPLTMHHVWPSGRGGPDDIRNASTMCAEHNRMVSQDAKLMAWAEANGWLLDAQRGPDWLEAGGVNQARDAMREGGA